MTDQNRPLQSAEEELAALGFYAPAAGEGQQRDAVSEQPGQSSVGPVVGDKPEGHASPEQQPATQQPVYEEVGSASAVDGHAQPDQPADSNGPAEADIQAALATASFEEAAVVQEVNEPQDRPASPETDELSIRDRALSIVDHLTDLRKRLIVSLVAFVIFLILSLFFVNKIYLFLTAPLGTKLTVLGPGEIIHVYFMIGGLAALVPTIPFVMWQLWLFVAPGLTERERRVTLTYIPAVLLVFIAGLVFGRFLVFPSLMKVLYGFSTQYTNYMPTADAYFSFMVRLLVPFGFIFEMPIIILFLTRLGILNPIRLTKFRKYAYFFIVLISFMLTPPEITSHLSLTVPMILLYELSIQISKYAYKKRLRLQQERASV